MNMRKLDPVIIRLLNSRGISSEEDIEEFLSDRPLRTYDPMLMKWMDEASDMVIDYAVNGRHICIYGDYDADGVMSAALLKSFLSNIAKAPEMIDCYIPQRIEEGYGLNMGAVKKIADSGAELLITVDCGCVSADEVKYAKELGMQVIVTDHHNIDKSRMPDCMMINPKNDDDYPFGSLCGCGVAFKLTQAIRKKTELPARLLNDNLDLVAIATVGDIVTLTDENRTMVKYGMDRIRRGKTRIGVKKLCEAAGININCISSYNIAFNIVPYINSAGRLSDARIALDLMLEQDEGRAGELAGELVSLNRKRRSIQDRIFKNALEVIEAGDDEGVKGNFILYYAGDAHEGVTGIVAGKLKEKYYKPVIIAANAGQEGYVKGTCRGIPGVDISEALNRNGALMERYGGHAAAGGLTMLRSNLTEFKKSLEDYMDELLAENAELMTEHIETADRLGASEISFSLAEQLEWLEPFGDGNRKPLFEVYDIAVDDVRRMGKERQYVKLQCSCGRGPGGWFDCVMFDTDIRGMYDIKRGDVINVIAEIGINSYNGRDSLQLTVRDIL